MKVYGITGGAGTGKSEVIKMLQQNFGGCVIMSDEVARELMQKGNISYQLIVEYFGRNILMDDGEIDRKKLADHVFNNKEALEKLNSMTHPYVKDEIRKLIAEAEASGECRFVALESAILLECGYEDICDEFWYVYTKPEIRRQRMKETRNYSDEKVDSVMRNQQPDEVFFEQCSFVIKNNTTLSDVYAQLKEKLDQQ
ncbi:dephospho-CoA kinase [Coprococcus sp. B2-R-112]|uniref:dephospho-CoA kinase n=1 Tax=Coprococcus sp. B2-R-112 TaxID=2949662 RepID=UPI00202FB3C1|nr:dephospho-CoA kinase [Coprococcus sp. B2-R-112]MCM0664191.1 dephospho-CoA kinase [Coprococcus sp. B2-R-112]